VLGAGGAARSIVDALGRVDVGEILIINRDPERAADAASLAARARIGTADDIAAADVLVNATSVGMGSDETPIDVRLLHSSMTVVDIVYHPLDTALLRAARMAGAAAVGGVGMLVHQAVCQQELWTGVRHDPSVLRVAAEAELSSRLSVADR
jgi:shikimate dehydrogenase